MSPVNSLKQHYKGRIVDGRTLKEAVDEGKMRVSSLVKCRKALLGEGKPSPKDMLNVDLKR